MLIKSWSKFFFNMKVLVAKLIKLVLVNKNTCRHDANFKKIIGGENNSFINTSHKVHIKE